jgi:uncharacterized membrane protein YphA (DoxX/SURF4 family)
MILHQLAQGMSSPIALDSARIILRAGLGSFFAISGYHKIFNKERRAALKATFDADGVKPEAAFMWAIPLGELSGGLGLLAGALMPLAAAGLILICLGACVMDGRKRVAAEKPLDFADRIDDWEYLPEFLMSLSLAVLIVIGAGQLSLDSLI